MTENEVTENFSFSSSRILGSNAHVLWHAGSTDAASRFHPHKASVTLQNEMLHLNLYLHHLSLERPESYFLTFEVKNFENYLKNNLFSTQDREFFFIYYPYSVFIFFPNIL